jgi:hypothetical protein
VNAQREAVRLLDEQLFPSASKEEAGVNNSSEVVIPTN